jgi:hypothetical protein
MLIALHIVLALVVFLFTTIGFSDGSRKQQVSMVLSFVWIALLATAFYSFGWKVGLASVLLSWVYAGLLRTPAAHFSVYLLGLAAPRGKGSWVGVPPFPLERISRELGRVRTPSEIIQELGKGADRKDAALDKLLTIIEDQRSTREVLQRHSATRETMREAYHLLSVAGAGQWVGAHYTAASALYYPESLEAVLSAGERGESNLETAYRVVEYFRSGSPLTSDDAPTSGLGL